MCMSKSGFTLVEVMLASIIGAFVALVAVGTLKAVSAGAEMVNNNIDTAAEVRFASRKIAADLMNLYRDRNLKNTKLVSTVEQSNEDSVSCLTFYTVGRVKARIDQPEGDVYEVEYCLLKDQEKSVLRRRVWPNPDENAQPGGVVTAIAEDIDVFEVRFFDGEDWQIEWPQEMKALPELIQVTIVAKQQSRTNTVIESFMVNFPRSAWGKTGTLDAAEQEKSESETETKTADKEIKKPER